MNEENDIFAQVAVQRYRARAQRLVAPEPIPVPKRTLPLDTAAGASAFEALPKLSTAAELGLKLDKARQDMAAFLADLAPPLEPSCLAQALEEFDWREETGMDRQDFASILAGAGQWSASKDSPLWPAAGPRRDLLSREVQS